MFRVRARTWRLLGVQQKRAIALGVLAASIPAYAAMPGTAHNSMPGAIAGSVNDVGRFDASVSAVPAPWQVVRFDQSVPATQYRVIAWDGVAAVEAVAKSSMALLARPLTIDLASSPILCWRWRIDAPLKKADMATRQGDDYAARVYLSFKLPAQAISFATRIKLTLARTLYGDQVPDAALNYVWDNRYPVGTSRPNAYTDRTRMIVLRSGPVQAGAWVSERRDVWADAVAAFGSERIGALQLALAADTDNTLEEARSGFADLHFIARDGVCHFSAPLPEK
ncbi:MAG: hypothetical protein ACI83P_001383 [Janthinobacterium sp.]|jgi:hypothetical protein